MKLRWKILIAGGLFLVLVATSMVVTLRVQPQSELEAYKKTLRAQGEKLEFSEILPHAVAPEDNSVDAVEESFRLSAGSGDKIPNAMKMVGPGRALVGWSQPEVRGYDFTNSWTDFGAEIEASRPAIELLHQVLDRPKLDFNLDYKLGAKLPLAHLAPLKRSVQRLEAAAIYELHAGNSGAAATNIVTMLALVHNNAAEGLLISHLVRIAMTAIAVTPTWELLQATNVSDAQQAAVQKGWQTMNFLGDSENSVQMERAWTLMEIEKMRASHEAFADLMSMGSGSSSGGAWGWPPDWEAVTASPRMAVGEVMWRSSWSYSEEMRMMKSDQIILETVRAMQTNRTQFYKADYDAMMSRVSALGLTNVGGAIFQALKIPDFHEEFGDWLNSAVRKTLSIEMACRMVTVAVALKRFQLKHGQWPATLGGLTPEFLPSVPLDSYDGKPLKYHANADGTFLLYSVGEDGVDDGGDATGPSNFYWQRARDWVWPQPATPAEVQNFYEHPPK